MHCPAGSTKQGFRRMSHFTAVRKIRGDGVSVIVEVLTIFRTFCGTSTLMHLGSTTSAELASLFRPVLEQSLVFPRKFLRKMDLGRLPPLLPSCRLPVASLSRFWHFWPPVAPPSRACCFPAAILSLPLLLPCRYCDALLPPSCPYPVTSCRFLSFPVAMLLFAWCIPVGPL